MARVGLWQQAGEAPLRHCSMFVLISLPRDRSLVGQLRIYDREGGDLIYGPVGCLGKADNARAAEEGNPSREPAKGYGDTPTGNFTWRSVGKGSSKRTFGPHRRWAMRGQTGDFLKREEAARARGVATAAIMIHGGDLTKNGVLRPTFGCPRVHNDDMAAMEALRLARGATGGEGRIEEE